MPSPRNVKIGVLQNIATSSLNGWRRCLIDNFAELENGHADDQWLCNYIHVGMRGHITTVKFPIYDWIENGTTVMPGKGTLIKRKNNQANNPNSISSTTPSFYYDTAIGLATLHCENILVKF